MFFPKLEDAHNIFHLRDMAKRRIPKWLFEFVDRGTEDEVALDNNRSIFDLIRLQPRVLVDVTGRKLDTSVFGTEFKMPLAVAPTGVAGMMWYRGELAIARACKDAGIPYTMATGSITSMEQVAGEVGGTLWMQLYMWPNANLSYQIVRRAAAAGFQALMLTVDTVLPGNREFNKRNGFSVPFKYNRRNTTDTLLHPRWLAGVMGRYMMDGGMPTRANFPDEMRGKITGDYGGHKEMRTSQALNWDDVKALRDIWPGKLVIKGVTHPDDAERSLEYGVDGIVVSNHGGRNCDAAPSPLEVLPEIAKAVKGRTTIIFDSGVRRGSDVVKALALGADIVMIGRSALYGVAAGGYEGASRVMKLYRGEIDRAMAQIACTRISDLGPQNIVLQNGFGITRPAPMERKPSDAGRADGLVRLVE